MIIQIAANPLGGHSNQSNSPPEIPEGWIEVPESLADKAVEFKFFISLVIEDGALVNVTPLEIPPPLPPPTPPLTNEELTKENNVLKAQNKALSESQQFLEDCVVEMAAAVYA